MAVTHGKRGVFVKLARFLHDGHELRDGDLAKHVAGALRFLHVPGQQTGVRLAHLRERFTGDKVDHLVEFETLIRLAPAEDGNLDHNVSRMLSTDSIRLCLAMSLATLRHAVARKIFRTVQVLRLGAMFPACRSRNETGARDAPRCWLRWDGCRLPSRFRCGL